MDSFMEAVAYKLVAYVVPLAAGFLASVAAQGFVDQLVAQIRLPLVGKYLATYLLAWSGPLLTKYLNIYASYILSYTANLDNLLKQVTKLKATRDMVREAVDNAKKKKGKVAVRAEVENWLTSVDKLTEEVTKLYEYKGDANDGWFRWFYGLLISRCRLSKKANKITERLVQVQADGALLMNSLVTC